MNKFSDISPSAELTAWPSLRLAIQEAGLDNQQLADALGMKLQSVRCWLRGSSVPPAVRLRKVAQALSVDVGDLLSDMPDPSAYVGQGRVAAWPSLANAIETQNITREDIAERTGVGPWTIRNWIYGQTTPNATHLMKLAEVLAGDENKEELFQSLRQDMPYISRRTQRRQKRKGSL